MLFLFSLMQRYAFCAVLPKRAQLCRRLSKRWGAGRVGLTDAYKGFTLSYSRLNRKQRCVQGLRPWARTP